MAKTRRRASRAKRLGIEQLEDRLLLTQFAMQHPPRVQLGDAPLTGFSGSSLDQVALQWQTVDVAGAATDSFNVEYRLGGTSDPWQAGGPVSQINTGVGTRVNHVSSITGLNWNTSYEYRVQHLRDSLPIDSWQNTFTTRLPAGDATAYSFAAYGDSAYTPTIANFNAVQSQINAGPAAFSILLGDMAYDSGSHVEYDARFDPNISPPATTWNAQHVDYPGFGNHDVGTASGQPTEENYSVPIPVAGTTAPAEPPATERPEHNYSFDYGDVHFVTFDTNSLNNASRLDGLLDWAVADLNASTATWKIVFGHHPIAGTPDKPESPADNYYQQVVSRLGAGGAGADLFVMGHSHTYSWTYPLTGQSGGQATFVNDPDKDYAKGAGLVQVVSGVAGRSLRSGDYSQFPFVAQGFTTTTSTPVEYGYSLIDVAPNQLTVKYVAADDGAVIDQFTISDLGDQTPPTADLSVPQDNGPADLDPAPDAVTVSATQPVFEIQLTDVGDGVDDATVTSATVALTRDGNPLADGTDYSFSYAAATDRISLTALGGDFGDALYDMTLSGGAALIADLAGNPMSAETITVQIDTSIQAASFQQGVGGYAGTVDTMLQQASPNANNAGAVSLNVDNDDPAGTGQDVQTLLRFDNIFGGGAGQIPAGSTIVSATLELQVSNPGAAMALHRMLQTWSDADSWNSLGAGVQADNVEATSSPDVTTAAVGTGLLTIDVTSSLQTWSGSPAGNFGWVLLPTGSDGVDFDSAEGTTPPRLQVQYSSTPGLPVVTITATDAGAAEAGPDNGVFTVTRSGDTAGNLDVAYTVAGTAAGGVDYLALSGSVTIPDGSAAATIVVTPIDDTDPEGDETVIVTLAADPAYNIGSPSQDTVTIADDDPIQDVALGESTIDGSVTAGSFTDTHASDNVYEAIREELYAGNKRTRLEHRWTFDVSGGGEVTFFVEAHHDSSVENFNFEYSTDQASWTPMLTVTKTVDDDALQPFVLPPTTSGTLYVRVLDSDRSRNENVQDTIFVDQMFIRSGGGPGAPTVTIAANDAAASEDGDNGQFTVSRTGTSGALEVFYAVGGSAANGLDYNTLSGSVTISDGSGSAFINVTPIDDALEEGSETVTLTLAADAAYAIGSPSSDTVTIADNDLTVVDDRAISESTANGSVTAGDFTDTHASDNVYEAVTEELYAGNKRSRLEHQWTFNVTGGSQVTFLVEAHHDSAAENFSFEYSTDGSSWTPMLTVTKTADDNTAQSFALPNSTSGTLFVRVLDSDRSRGENSTDTLFVDDMLIRSDNSGAAPPAAGQGAPEGEGEGGELPASASAALFSSNPPVFVYHAGWLAEARDDNDVRDPAAAASQPRPWAHPPALPVDPPAAPRLPDPDEADRFFALAQEELAPLLEATLLEQRLPHDALRAIARAGQDGFRGSRGGW